VAFDDFIGQNYVVFHFSGYLSAQIGHLIW